jgi:hypothetical protein
VRQFILSLNALKRLKPKELIPIMIDVNPASPVRTVTILMQQLKTKPTTLITIMYFVIIGI